MSACVCLCLPVSACVCLCLPVSACVCLCVYLCVWLLSHSLCSLIQGTVREPGEFYQKIEGNAGAWGKAVATIDASAARAFADRWCLNSHEYKKEYAEEAGADAFRKVVNVEDSHSMILVFLARLPSPCVCDLADLAEGARQLLPHRVRAHGRLCKRVRRCC